MMEDSKQIHLVECPRDAMQGWKHQIPAELKAKYINALLQVGFPTIDFGSFVSAAAIPQMADTKEVLGMLDLKGSKSKLLAIVANRRGAEEAAAFQQISYLGFPFSVSETFQQRNTNSTIAASLKTVQQLQEICDQADKKAVVYISMGFGNPYGDPWSAEIVYSWVDKLIEMGISIISLADTVGLATPEQVSTITRSVVEKFPSHEIGVHLHSSPEGWEAKASAAFDAGCRRFDGALKGIGGCPMADDELVGNMDTEKLIPFFEAMEMQTGVNHAALAKAAALATKIFV